ncbi:hypothetical protein C3747_73g193 [Trypanosoma cruzi]|uniref:Uncharacterized protein n=2 Tax=Trypanosoma cruzi TaxID=5693 RepID=Q4D5U4_TRYCC|nr:hypothetical protein, conserved [Trypanosoma cruzi]EAN87897.1 hypothetical protein, conserved [Trypanosoma cruzi]PWV09915.1 hypothetical protein C3747_73g193 [Trypanosoma cruzi]|eukprot:XP_809748.1 hypothetical protein [Trypanosoma cruzi strain CL Brener]
MPTDAAWPEMEDDWILSLPGSESVAILTRCLDRTEESIQRLRLRQGEEMSSFQNTLDALNGEETRIWSQFHVLEMRWEELTALLWLPPGSLNAESLWDEMHQLSLTEVGLQVVEAQTEENIHSLRARMAHQCHGTNPDGILLFNERLVFSRYHMSRAMAPTCLCHCAGYEGHPAVLANTFMNLDPLLDVDVAGDTAPLEAGTEGPHVSSLQLKEFLEAITSPTDEFYGVRDTLGRFASVSPPLVLQRDEDGNTPLHIVCRLFNPSLVVMRELLQAGADVNVKNSAGLTPFHMACVNKSEKNRLLMELLLDSGCDVNVRTAEGETAAHMCAADDMYFRSIEFLYHVGGDFSAKAFVGGAWCTPIDVARANGVRASCIFNQLNAFFS